MGTNHSIEQPVIFFDGVCNLCNGAVQFIIRRDPKDQFRFASLQSDLAQSSLPEDLVQSEDLQSIVLLDSNGIHTKSTAVLKITRKLKGLWPVLYLFIIIPTFIRDAIYGWVAHNRYKWFGKKDQCMIPTPELQERFYS